MDVRQVGRNVIITTGSGVGDDALYCDNRYFDEVTNRYVLEGDAASIHFNGNLCICTLQYPGNSL
ncbi:MAG: hypothetical protein AB2777_20840 [Candidatus Thiodiazotropha endolucinida]